MNYYYIVTYYYYYLFLLFLFFFNFYLLDAGSISSTSNTPKKIGGLTQHMSLSRSLDRLPPQPSIDSLESQQTSVTKRSVKYSKRDANALVAAQAKASDRLASHNKSEGNLAFSGNNKEFR
jgi:hypothetical protein